MSRTSKVAQSHQECLRNPDSTSSATEQTQKRTVSNGSNGFLDHVFEPLYLPPNRKHCPPMRSAERQILASYALLCEIYGLAQLDVSEKSYPLNILLCQKDAQRQLRSKGLVGTEISIFLIENNVMCMGISGWHHFSVENIGYIPVVNVVARYQENPSSKAIAIIIMIFRYLHKVVGIPHYADDSWGFVQEQYDNLMQSWLGHDSSRLLKIRLEEALKTGKHVKTLLSNNPDQKEFKKLLGSFIPSNRLEQEILDVGKLFYRLFCKYPKTDMFVNSQNYNFGDDIDYSPISMDFFVSFVFENNDCLHRHVINELNYFLDQGIEGHIPYQQILYIPGKPASYHLAFERTLFSNIRKLINLLNLL